MLVRSLVISVIAHVIPLGFMLHETTLELEEPPDNFDELTASQAAESVDNLPPVSIAIIDEVRPRVRILKNAKADLKQASTPGRDPTETVASIEPTPAVKDITAIPGVPIVEAPADVVAPVEAPQQVAQERVEECPPDRPGLIPVSDNSWAIERNLVDFYATHLKELTSLAWVPAHKDENGKPDGFKVVLKKCSILRNGGLQSQDVVTDVGGVRVHSIFTAIKAYIKLRKKSTISLSVRRGGQELTLTYELR